MEQVLQPIQRFYDSAVRNPGAIAIAGEEDISYAELRGMVDALASSLQAIDGAVGSRVGICARNTTEHLIALLATYAAGKVWIPLNPRNGRAELDSMIAATRPAIIVADQSCLDRFTPTGRPTIVAKGTGVRTVRGLIAERAGTKPRWVERDQDDPQIIKFSGGSTGAPKPVVQPLRCVNAQAEGLRDFFDFNADDVNLIAAPLTHGASCFVLPVLEVGGRHVMIEQPKAPTILDHIGRYGVTTMYAPPTMLYAMLDASEVSSPKTQSLRHLIYSAAPMSPERIRECQRVFGPVIETAYGQVEAPQIVTAMRARELLAEANLTSVGRASPVATVATMNPDGEILPPGEVGEIVVAGPLLMTGYLERPEDTRSTIVNGWLHTGDVGVLDDRGYLFIRGRLREVINTGGFKVFPGEVEVSLARHPAVRECAVFGVADPRWGEAVNAAVVTASAIEVPAEQLIAFVKAELGSVKAPKRIWFVDSLERNAAGKVSRASVREAILARGP